MLPHEILWALTSKATSASSSVQLHRILKKALQWNDIPHRRGAVEVSKSHMSSIVTFQEETKMKASMTNVGDLLLCWQQTVASPVMDTIEVTNSCSCESNVHSLIILWGQRKRPLIRAQENLRFNNPFPGQALSRRLARQPTKFWSVVGVVNLHYSPMDFDPPFIIASKESVKPNKSNMVIGIEQ